MALTTNRTHSAIRSMRCSPSRWAASAAVNSSEANAAMFCPWR